MERDEVEKLLIKAGNYTARYEKSAKEVRDKLLRWSKGEISEDEIDEIIERLKVDKFIDEERFVERFIRDKIISLRKGPIMIKRELIEKGISERTAQSALAKVSSEEWQEALGEYLSARLERQKSRAKNGYDLRQRLIGLSYGRGYPTDLSLPVIDSLDLEMEEGEDYFEDPFYDD